MDDLTKAAKALDARLEVLAVPRSNLPLDNWSACEAGLPGVVPAWYKQLLAEYAFMEVYLNFPRWDYGFPLLLRLLSPDEILTETKDDMSMIQHGWFPFAEERDANLWAMRLNATPDSPIIFLVHTNGGIEGEGGMIYAAHRLSHLFATASISSGRKEHLKDDGYVDMSKAGYRMWGENDALINARGVRDGKELLKCFLP